MQNPIINIQSSALLSDNHFILKKYILEYTKNDGTIQTQKREVYDRGNGATILLFNKQQKTVILISQFRLPTYLNGNKSGMIIEACAGTLEEENPKDCIKRETEEETGYTITEVKKVFQAYMSPGSVTEIIYFFVAEYSKEMKTSQGGGLESESENIDVLELPFDKAYEMIATGEIKDAKTIMLLQYAKLNNLVNA